MFHSVPVSEPLAIGLSVLVGLLLYGLASLLGAGPDASVWIAVTVSGLVNLAVGLPINLYALDVLSLLLVRPFSPFLTMRLLALCLPGTHG